ncbi:hypothetical protein CERZMDRAFT_93633 [Cercospora zeae-maydis SCOH1-5]|uniref:Uncharacterized protein n=1 Tax=Cercospora zeae-maydis SCOH1-5 TaxID=717836 RepID=A0A6A6FSB1_9PEZI|nr:hypothetical protein CERZMDRAFT_93633 [Cercospora zeae-maydis SCOH1-5]
MPALSLPGPPPKDESANEGAQPRAATPLEYSNRLQAKTSTAASSKCSASSKSESRTGHRNERKSGKSQSKPPQEPKSTTPPSSTASPNEQPPTTSPEKILSLLDNLVTSELRYWAHYMSATTAQTNYTAITSNEATTETKFAALGHILETLPLRHKGLASGYSNTEFESVELPENLQTLLESLEKEEATEAELEGWYDSKWQQRKKFRSDVLHMDDEVRRLEEKRMQELKDLMLMVEEMKLAAADGAVDDEALTHLIRAFDEVGLGAISQRKARAWSHKIKRRDVVPRALQVPDDMPREWRDEGLESAD